jgi:hypothetical protein
MNNIMKMNYKWTQWEDALHDEEAMALKCRNFK